MVSLEHFSAQQLNFMQHPASFVSENLFSVLTSDLRKRLTKAPHHKLCAACFSCAENDPKPYKHLR